MAQQPLIFMGLGEAEVSDVLASARPRKFRRGDLIFHEGDPGDSLHVITKGRFGLRVTTPLGQRSVLRVFGAGDVFGRVALPPIDAVREMTVDCLDAGETFELHRPQLEVMRTRYPSISDGLIAATGRELYWVSHRLLEMLYVDADRRVRRRLLELGEQYANGERETVISLTQEDIASLAGTSRATTSRVLGEEARYGTLVKRRGSIVLLDTEPIARRARLDPMPLRL